MSEEVAPLNQHRRSRSRFRPEEDEAIRKAIEEHGRIAWSRIASILPNRTARQVRERWLNYLTPEVSHAPWTEEEDKELLRAVSELGRAWSLVAKQFVGRTDVTVKNRYKLLMRRRRKMEEPQEGPHIDDLSECNPSNWKIPRWEFSQIPPLK